MKVMNAEWKDRLKHWERTLKEDFYMALGEIQWEAYRTMEQLSREEVLGKQFQPVENGYVWGNTYEYCWFKGAFTLSDAAEGERIVLHLDPGGESTLFVNGETFGTYRASWVKEEHHFFEDNTLVEKAKSGEYFEVLMESYAGHYYPECADGGCTTGPVLPGAFTDPAEEGKRCRLGICTYGIWNEDAYQLYMDVRTLSSLLEVLDETSLRTAHVAKALEQFTLTVDFEQNREGRIDDYRKARQVLKPVLDAVNGSTVPKFYAVGNAHLDLAWLWPMAETYRKTERTFAAQLRLLEEYPEYKFIQSQPASYEMCRKYYPDLFEKIRKAAKKGQWIADGAMWVEPDTNMAGGEALIRQLVYGKKYYKEYFDVDSETLWLPDTFGYSAVLPQILKGCKVKYLVTQKIFWSYNDGEQFPYHYFNWEGMDGSSVVSFLPTNYTYDTDPATINQTWKNRSQTRDLEAFLLPFGYGDGGGGPTRDHVEYALRQKNLEGGAQIQLAGPAEFFEDMEALGGPVHTYVGELYFSAHRGTYTSQAMVKKNNRRCEAALRGAELWSAMAVQAGFCYPKERLEELWKMLLLHQFHDILPGSSIGRVYEEAEPVYEQILEGCQEIQKQARQAMMTEGEGVTIFNGQGFSTQALVTLPERFLAGAKTRGGKAVPVAKTGDEVKALVTLPAFGTLTLLPDETADVEIPTAQVKKTETGYCMENSQVRALVDNKGEIISFMLKSSGREFAAGAMNHLQMYKDVARLFDAWDIDSNYIDQETDGAYDITLEVIKEKGLEAALKVTGNIGSSSYVQIIRLAAESRRIEVAVNIDWKEQHRLLKVAFPVSVYAEEGINEMQFGYVKRPTHRSRAYDKDRFEVCNHRYSALYDGAHGAAVLNDSKYGISMNGNRLELSLLKSACSPEMRADNRVHDFTYAFTAWEGNFADCDVVQQGYELNTAPVVQEGYMEEQCNFKADRANIMLETVKLAEDGSGDWIVRLYEAKKAAVNAAVSMPIMEGRKVYLCDMLENQEAEIAVNGNTVNLDFRAFEIRTLRIQKG
ncbi:MAG: glycoside hydrolase family 38 C-terminal domain-containing protein [Lachnospiraceae bacterium]|nr:glycoside hydrolase family 38 C-terminal domain-containing protein [Lachnospiraceae bacterium]